MSTIYKVVLTPTGITQLYVEYSGMTNDSLIYLISADLVATYGRLYNYCAVSGTGSTSLANTGWHVPSYSELQTLQSQGGNFNYQAIKVRTTGTTYWDYSDLAIPTNQYKFNARGAGYRDLSGNFSGLNRYTGYWSTTANVDPLMSNLAWLVDMNYNDSLIRSQSTYAKASGFSVRLIKDSTSLISGQTSTYTGNDGTVYGTICIGTGATTQEWLSQNLYETKFRNLDLIPIITLASDWYSLASGSTCNPGMISYGSNEASSCTYGETLSETSIQVNLVNLTNSPYNSINVLSNIVFNGSVNEILSSGIFISTINPPVSGTSIVTYYGSGFTGNYSTVYSSLSCATSYYVRSYITTSSYGTLLSSVTGFTTSTPTISIPTTFTPNGTLNRTFVINGLDYCFTNNHMKIVNSGSTVYLDIDNYQYNFWNGKLNNSGTLGLQGNYYFILTTTGTTYTGSVYLNLS